jgi:hypothetical protein
MVVRLYPARRGTVVPGTPDASFALVAACPPAWPASGATGWSPDLGPRHPRGRTDSSRRPGTRGGGAAFARRIAATSRARPPALTAALPVCSQQDGRSSASGTGPWDPGSFRTSRDSLDWRGPGGNARRGPRSRGREHRRHLVGSQRSRVFPAHHSVRGFDRLCVGHRGNPPRPVEDAISVSSSGRAAQDPPSTKRRVCEPRADAGRLGTQPSGAVSTDVAPFDSPVTRDRPATSQTLARRGP